LRGRFQSAQKPSANGRPVRRMNSASGGLRPTVGLRRPGGGSLRRRRPTPGAQRLEGPISIGTKAFGRRSACADREGVLRRRRPTPGAERLEGRFQSAQKPSANGRPAPTGRGFCVGGGRRLARSALGGRFQSAQKPSADGRPVPTEKRSLRRRRPTPGAGALRGRFQSAQKPSANGRPVRRMNSASRGLRPTVGLRRPKSVPCVGGGRRLARSALRGRFQSAQKPSANGRPVPTEKRSLRRRRPTPGAERLEGPISIGTKAFGRRSACADRKAFPASAEADAWRGAP
jgi:hypothetical protein